MTATRTEPDTVTCPPWCRDPHELADPWMFDEHISRDVAKIALSLTTPVRSEGAWRAPRLIVYLTSDAEYGPGVHVDLDEADGLHLTAAEARALAASLLEAAELAEETGE